MSSFRASCGFAAPALRPGLRVSLLLLVGLASACSEDDGGTESTPSMQTTAMPPGTMAMTGATTSAPTTMMPPVVQTPPPAQPAMPVTPPATPAETTTMPMVEMAPESTSPGGLPEMPDMMMPPEMMAEEMGAGAAPVDTGTAMMGGGASPGMETEMGMGAAPGVPEEMPGGMGGAGGEPEMQSGAFALSSPSWDVVDNADCDCDVPDVCPVYLEQHTNLGSGGNVSPEMNWSGAPDGTQSYAIWLVDLTNGGVHWVIWDIPGSETGLPEGLPGGMLSEPAGATQAANFGMSGHFGSGACGNVYEYRVFALSVPNLSPGNGVEGARTALQDSQDILAESYVRLQSREYCNANNPGNCPGGGGGGLGFGQ